MAETACYADYSPTPWWSIWEVMSLILEYFADVEPFVREDDHLVNATRAHLIEIFSFPADSKDLELELAAYVDVGNHLLFGGRRTSCFQLL